MSMARWLIRRALDRRKRQMAQALNDPAAAQARLLAGLLRRAAGTEWGRRYGFDRIRTVRDYRSAVPICTYEDMAAHWHRAFDGARDVAWPGHIRYFSLTSGTTLGASKAMPVSNDALRVNRGAALSLLLHIDNQAPAAELYRGRTLYFGGCTALKRQGACLKGDASGINALQVPRIARRYRLPEPEVSALSDWEAKVNAICDRYLRSPVRAVVGLPSWTLILFRRLVDCAKARIGRHVETVGDVWPDLSVFVHFGMAFAPYAEQFREIIGRPAVFVDTYSSSEGGLNAIQSRQDDPGMQLELDSGAFYEFVPLDEWGRQGAPRLTIGEVEADRPYALLLTTASGIWSYDVGDAVRFTSLDPPKIVFATRTALQLNDFGEHVLQEHVDAAMAAACRRLGARVRDFTVGAVMPTAAHPRGRHRWLVEFEGAPPAPAALSALLDQELIAASDDYASHRAGGFGLDAPEVAALRPNAFFDWSKSSGRLGGQNKIPRVAASADMAAWLMERAQDGGETAPVAGAPAADGARARSIAPERPR